MSPRAAWRLERLGYTVSDYTAGKADWIAAGRGTFRAQPSPLRAIDVLEREVATCSPDALLADLTRNMSDYIVVNDDRVVLGRIRKSAIARSGPHMTVEQVMESGPATIRADANVDHTRERLRQHRVHDILVTTPEGQLLGVLAMTTDSTTT